MQSTTVQYLDWTTRMHYMTTDLNHALEGPLHGDRSVKVRGDCGEGRIIAPVVHCEVVKVRPYKDL
jgi:hypothetical protein